MIRTMQFESGPIEYDTSSGWLYEYEERFGHDIFPDLMPVIESVLAAIASVLEDSGGEFNEKTIASAFNNDSLIDAFIKMAGWKMTTIMNIFWAMVKNADASTPAPKQFYKGVDNPEWDKLLPELLNAIIESSVSSKNADRLLQRLKNVRNQ